MDFAEMVATCAEQLTVCFPPSDQERAPLFCMWTAVGLPLLPDWISCVKCCATAFVRSDDRSLRVDSESVH